MEADAHGGVDIGPTARVSVGPSPSPCLPCRLKSRLREPNLAIPPARRTPAWVSLQGRLVGAEGATSARAVGAGLGKAETMAWELLSPLHRVLLVAVVAVATAESERLRKIAQLRRSVDVRDQVLLHMQQKLEDLCEQMNSSKNQLLKCVSKISPGDDQFAADGISKQDGAEFCSYKHGFSGQNRNCGISSLRRNLSDWSKDLDEMEPGEDEGSKSGHLNLVEREERRMSDLSDLFCSSTTSSVDIQLNALAEEQEFYNLRKEVEEKDATIKELTTAAHASSVAASKRITELEETIKRKNMVMTRLKKDMVFLEQKVIQLTRAARSSSAAPNESSLRHPVMANNILYDMSSTSPSSSDSDFPIEQRERQCHGLVARDSLQQSISEAIRHEDQTLAESFISSNRFTDELPKQQPVSPVKDSCDPVTFGSFQGCGSAAMKSQPQSSTKSFISSTRSTGRFSKQLSVSSVEHNYIIHQGKPAAALRPKRFVSSGGGSKRIRRCTRQELKSTVHQKKWV